MATATRTISSPDTQGSSISSRDNFGPASPRSGGILANAHEAPKKAIKPADSSFTSALKSAFIPQQAGKQMRANGKPLGKSFERTQPLATKGHDGGEVLKRDPRGQNAPCGDGVVLATTDADEEDVEDEYHEAEVSAPWSPTSATSDASTVASSTSSSSTGDSQPSSSWEQAVRGRSNTQSSSISRSTSRSSSQASSNNPCSIKFAPLPSSGRLKRANSITIGVAARSQLLHSQGGGRASNGANSNSAAWQTQINAQRSGGSNDQFQQPQRQSNSASSVIRQDDTIDVGEEIRKGAMKAWRRMRKGSVSSNGSASESSPSRQPSSTEIEPVKEEETHELMGGESTPKRSQSPVRMPGVQHSNDEDDDGADGTRTPKHSMQRRLSTGAFIGNQSFLEIEEKRKRESRGLGGGEEEEVGREQEALFAEALGRTHASRVAHHTIDDKWHPGVQAHLVKPGGHGDDSSSSSSLGESGDGEEEDDEDEESREAERLANEALKGHSTKATKAGAVEKMERKQR